jgi:hypothetical protein
MINSGRLGMENEGRSLSWSLENCARSDLERMKEVLEESYT